MSKPHDYDEDEFGPIPDNEPEFRDTGDRDRYADDEEREQVEHDPDAEAEGE